MYFLAQETLSRNLIQYYLDRLATPGGAMLVVGGVMLAALVVGVDRFKWLILTLGIYLGSYAYNRSGGDVDLEGIVPLPAPFSTIASLTQPLTFGCLLLVAIACMKPVPWQRSKLVHPAAILLLLTLLVITFRQFFGGLPERALFGVCIYTTVFLVLGMGLSRWLYDDSHIRTIARCVSWFAVLLCASTIVVLAIDWDAGFVSNRLTGITDNPQRTGIILALSFPFSLLLATDPGNTRQSRWLHLLIAATAAGFLVFTGSRTAALTLMVGTAVFFRKRIGALAAAVLGLAVVFLLVMSFAEGDLASARDNVFRTNDTRSAIWISAFKTFLTSPLIGHPLDGNGGESSYLTVAVQSGVLGVLPLVLMLLLLIRSMVKLSKFHNAGPYAPAINLGVASICQFMVVWLFEAYLVAFLTNTVFILYCTLAVITLVNERVAGAMVASPEQHGFDVLPLEEPYGTPAY